jgi:ectoine hydroxylase-related dioxygenase (phytanoyl-CoA dioxygenase family)
MLRRSEPWFRELWSSGESADREERLMRKTTEIGGVSVRVVELTGEPGDVALMHPWMLHAPAPNGSSNPRIMITHRIPTAGLAHYWI